MAFCGAGKVVAASPQTTPTDVCVLMTGSSGQVGGLQLDLRWDPTCMTAQQTGDNSVQCASNPATGKNVQTSLFSDHATMRALFFSISNTKPIPDNSELFCCKFATAGSRSTSCCAATIGNLILAGPSGGRVYDSSISVQVLVNNAPCTDSKPGGSPSNPVRPPAPSSLGAPAPVIVAPGAAAPASGGGAAGTRLPPGIGAPAGGGAPEAVGAGTGLEPAPLPTEAVAPTAPAVQPTPGVATPRTATPQRTLAPTAALTPKPQGTATAVASATPQLSASTPASTATPAPTAKKRHKQQGSQ